MGESLFSIENLYFSSRTVNIIKDISFTIQAGTTTILDGESGSGKSTLLKLVAGILVPTGGRVLFNGKDIQLMTESENKEFRKKTAFVFQDSALWANQDILQNVSLPLQTHFPKMRQAEQKRKVTEICTQLDYDRLLSLRPSDLSMGEQKKIAIARAFITSPQILFLDECTESLDKKSADVVIKMIQDFLSKGRSLVYVSHSGYFKKELPGVIHILNDGMLVGEK